MRIPKIQTTSHLMLALLALGTVALAILTCAHVEPSRCYSDRDCKLQRICDLGTCVWRDRPQAPPGATVAATSSPGGARLPAAAPWSATENEPISTMFRFGPLHRGRSPFVLPRQRPSVAGAYVTGGPISSSPVLVDDGAAGGSQHHPL